MPPAWLIVEPGSVVLRVRVQPRARTRAVQGIVNDRLRVRVTEPPADGAANAAVIELIAGLAGVPKSAIGISHGSTTREKTLRITTGDAPAVAERLRATIPHSIDKPGGAA
jgi:uncharacterized protein (TIGR00251 family)